MIRQKMLSREMWLAAEPLKDEQHIQVRPL
jgi:hypothetical protein